MWQCVHGIFGRRSPFSSLPPPETPGHSQASLVQSVSVVGSLLFSPGSWCAQGFVCALQEFVSPVQCKFWWLCGGVKVTSSKRGLCHTKVCCNQSPCISNSLLLIPAGDTQTQFWLSLCGVSGSWCAQSLFEPSDISGG